MACAVGDTLIEGTRMLSVYGGKADISERQLRASIRVADERTFEQDPKYPMRLLVDIAIKALSPAINDPTTAVQAIDQIEDLLRRLAKCDLETCEAVDPEGIVRVIYQVPSWNDYLTLAFDEISPIRLNLHPGHAKIASRPDRTGAIGRQRSCGAGERLSPASRCEHRSFEF